MNESIVLQLIEKEFSKRRLINPSYSLRAYSKSLGVSPSNLSRILAKKKEITPNVVKKIAGSLKFDEELLKNLVDYHSKVKKSKNIKNIDNENIKRLDLETFSVISEWYHYAILEVYNLSSKKKITPEFIQKKLGLDAKTVTNALK
ncbi:MAG: helix-turn-helix domain-containing protein, partial [Bdellovibrionales bacterium]|nr:helix-turn-helix domain-containing protein [Bdellovibrionales bacterium]